MGNVAWDTLPLMSIYGYGIAKIQPRWTSAAANGHVPRLWKFCLYVQPAITVNNTPAVRCYITGASTVV